MVEKPSKALTAIRTLRVAAMTLRAHLEEALEEDVVPPYLDDTGQWQSGGTVKYRAPEADQIQADLDDILRTLAKYEPQQKAPISIEERHRQMKES